MREDEGGGGGEMGSEKKNGRRCGWGQQYLVPSTNSDQDKLN